MNERPSPDGVRMVRQQNPAVNGEGMHRPSLQDGIPQSVSNRFIAQKRLPAKRHNRKEISATRYRRPPIPRNFSPHGW
ncbi:hypothetical protein DSTSK_36010 [Desulforhabdus sp. TSK]|nr:hypothetical protein DSTSK_36010 [Desulforhabdus sp. TSK]